MIQLKHLQSLSQKIRRLPREKWKKSQSRTFGGSEVAAVIGKCKYRTLADVVRLKREGSPPMTPACAFGSVFEKVAKVLLEIEHQSKVYMLHALPHTRLPVWYSSDGIMVDGDKLVLIEIKCPFKRINLKYPHESHVCQLQMGMDIMPCDEGWLYQCRFRVCAKEQLGGSSDYNRGFHGERFSRVGESKLLAWGIIHFPGPGPVVDLGVGPPEGIIPFRSERGRVYVSGYPDIRGGHVLGWKLFDHALCKVRRDPFYFAGHKKAIWDAAKVLRE